LNRLTFELEIMCVWGEGSYERTSPWIESQDHRSRSKVNVKFPTDFLEFSLYDILNIIQFKVNIKVRTKVIKIKVRTKGKGYRSNQQGHRSR